MTPAPHPSLTPAVVFGLLRKHAYLWIAPAIAGLAITAVGTLVSKRMWSASQGLIVRSEAAGYADQRLGKFTDLSEMKTVQETMLELARSRSVVTAVLKQVGPASSWATHNWPSREDVQKLRKRLTITPPGGAEFGNTEVFYIEVQDHNPQRAEKLVAALADQLESRLQSLRNERAGSMVNELERSVAASERNLKNEVERLAAFEAGLGSQLSELRNLMSASGGQSSLQQQASEIEQEVRQLDASRRRNEELISTLRLADHQPEALLATPSTLLEAQPTLLRLKEGLVDAQIRTASLLASRSPEHPFVKAAELTELNLRQEIQSHAPEAIRGAQIELSVYDAREASLRSKLSKLHRVQSEIADHRAEYALLLANVENQTRVTDAARKQLSDAQAHLAGAGGASVLARLDRAEAGLYPIGPGAAVTTLAGGLAGLIAGVGAVFVFYGPHAKTSAVVARGELEPTRSPAATQPRVVYPAEDPAEFDRAAGVTGVFVPTVNYPFAASHTVFAGS